MCVCVCVCVCVCIFPPGKNTGVRGHFLLQGIFPTQGIEPMSPVSPALQVDSLLLEPLGKSLCITIFSLKVKDTWSAVN